MCVKSKRNILFNISKKTKLQKLPTKASTCPSKIFEHNQCWQFWSTGDILYVVIHPHRAPSPLHIAFF